MPSAGRTPLDLEREIIDHGVELTHGSQSEPLEFTWLGGFGLQGVLAVLCVHAGAARRLT